MEAAFQSIGDSDRIWVYQADRFLGKDEINLIRDSGKAFVATWAAHGKALRADITILHSLFVIVSVDEEQALASGCSIDKSMNWIIAMGHGLDVDFVNRQQVAWIDEKAGLQAATLPEFEALAANGQIEEDTLVFNNLVFSGKELKNSWLIPARESWHSKYFSIVAG